MTNKRTRQRPPSAKSAGMAEGPARVSDKPEGRDVYLQLQRRLLESSLEPLKEMVRAGETDGDTATALLVNDWKTRRGDSRTASFRKFVENSGPIFENEPYFDAGYDLLMDRSYMIAKASSNAQLFFKIYQHLSGEPYDSPKQLLKIMREIAKGKRFLELGCGPGFCLGVLRELGAEVAGVEMRLEFANAVPEAGVRCGDAEFLGDLFGDSRFDVIYSHDFFCESVVLERLKSLSVAAAAFRHMEDGGLGIHQINCWKMPLPVFLFDMWVTLSQRGDDFEQFQNTFWNLPPEEMEDSFYTNRFSLDPQDLLRLGVEIKELSLENDVFTLVARKPLSKGRGEQPD